MPGGPNQVLFPGILGRSCRQTVELGALCDTQVMNIYITTILIAATLLSSTTLSQEPTQGPIRPGDKVPQWVLDYRVPLPKEGLVPDKETAIQIAEIVLFRLYGKEKIVAQRPYEVKKEDYFWWISGTLKEPTVGSPFRIAISKQTAAVLHVE